MASRLSSGRASVSTLTHSLLRPTLPPSTSTAAATTTPSQAAFSGAQVRHATLIPRPRRPYTFTQLVQLSDGSTYTIRTTSPQPVYKSGRDTRNHALWQPSDKSLRNVELDEAGKLAAFRERYGRGFDLDEAPADGEADAAGGSASGGGDLGDLISGYAVGAPEAPPAPLASKRDKGKKK